MPIIQGTIHNRKEFTGKEFDNDGATISGDDGMNLYYFGARFYDPEIFRWISTDPAEEFWDTYSYTGGNPIILIDPMGLYTDVSKALAHINLADLPGGDKDGGDDDGDDESNIQTSWSENLLSQIQSTMTSTTLSNISSAASESSSQSSFVSPFSSMSTDKTSVNLTTGTSTTFLETLSNLNTVAQIGFGFLAALPEPGTTAIGLGGLTWSGYAGMGIRGARSLTGEISYTQAGVNIAAFLFATGAGKLVTSSLIGKGFGYSSKLGRFRTITTTGAWRITSNARGITGALLQVGVSTSVGLGVSSVLGGD